MLAFKGWSSPYSPASATHPHTPRGRYAVLPGLLCVACCVVRSLHARGRGRRGLAPRPLTCLSWWPWRYVTLWEGCAVAQSGGRRGCGQVWYDSPTGRKPCKKAKLGSERAASQPSQAGRWVWYGTLTTRQGSPVNYKDKHGSPWTVRASHTFIDLSCVLLSGCAREG